MTQHLRHGVARLHDGRWPFELTPTIVRAACLDAGERCRRSHGLLEWDQACWDAATAEYDRLVPLPDGVG
ncbi:MAG: hypothetical protein ACREE9_09350 [Stellaceae bacterium]